MTDGILSVIAVSDSPPVGQGFAAVLTSERDLEVLELASGRTLWSWTGPESANLSGPGSTKLVVEDQRIALFCFPSYSTRGLCIDLCTPDGPQVRWEREFGATFDAGFGPVLVLGDPLGLGRSSLVLSSRTGSDYNVDAGVDGGTVPTEKLVLGREDGALYQAVLDPESGDTLAETSYRPDPGPYPCARPYGLLQVAKLAPDLPSDIVLVSCQVEEYVSLTRSDGGALSRRWGQFIERDWPVDVQELRPQVTSIADVRGDQRPLLVVGHWHDDAWETLLIDPCRGWTEGVVARLPGRYFWGCHDLDGDGVAEIVVSQESHRLPAPRSTLEIVDGRDLSVLASLDDCRVLTSSDSELPSSVAFHASRAGSLVVPGPDSRSGLLILQGDSTVWWTFADGAGKQLTLLREAAVRADYRNGRLILTTSRSRLVGFDQELSPVAETRVSGRRAEPLAWRLGGRGQVVAACADDTVAAWELDGENLREVWRVTGTNPALHVDGSGVARLAVARSLGDVHRVVTYRFPAGAPIVAYDVAVAAPAHDLLAFGEDFRLVANLRTGVHTASLAVLDEDGREVWRDEAHGAHPNLPAAFASVEGTWMVAYDDHGELFIREGASGALIAKTNWTAAYTTPVALPEADVLIRADGVHGIECISMNGASIWRADAALWNHYPGNSALMTAPELLLCSYTRGGAVEAVRVDTGTRQWSEPLGPGPERRPIVALDVDADGADEVIVGAPSGELLCLSGLGDRAVRTWSLPLGAQIQALAVADLSGEGSADLVVATADGRLRIVRV